MQRRLRRRRRLRRPVIKTLGERVKRWAYLGAHFRFISLPIFAFDLHTATIFL